MIFPWVLTLSVLLALVSGMVVSLTEDHQTTIQIMMSGFREQLKENFLR